MPAPSASERPERHIALIRPQSSGQEKPELAIQLLESMLWALQGTTRSNWISATSPELADVVVVYESDRDQRLSGWKSANKEVVIIAGESAGPAQPGENVLIYPFRATQVLELLNRLDELIALSTTAPVARLGPQTWGFLEALRTLREVQNSEVWLVGKLDKMPVIWLKGDGTEYAADPVTLQSIRLGDLDLGAIKLQRGEAPPSHRSHNPAVELCWFAGYHAGTQLAPWLNPTARFRIKRWPDFGLIRPLPSQIRCTATLATSALTLNEIASRARLSMEEAIRTLNALAACELLTVEQSTNGPAPVSALAVPEPVGGFRSFLRLVRKRLGLSPSP